MTLNREVFFKDPTTNVIPNQGVAKVGEPRKPEEWEVLKFELSSFVCQGEYQRGLERILSAYLQNLNNPEQPAVWVSGFYGSGKSHLVRVLEYLWREVEFPDGARARGLAKLPADLKALLVELSTAGKRAGGLWSAAGTLGAGAGNSIRLALLGILFQSANLPVQYSPARFVIWLKQNGYYDAVRSGVEKRDKEFGHELRNMYVSPVLAQSLLDAIPEFATSLAGVREILRTQFPLSEEIGDDEMLHVMEDVLELQSTTPGKLPCTLIVLDELQQFIGEDGGRALQVQNVVEACSARFDSKLLLVATGQAALQATPQLSKLQGRFTVRVALSDADIENVVREVVLRKAPDKTQELKAALNQVSGEIDRQLAGTKIGAIAADKDDLIADYPLLPVRRRFWERVLRAIDTGGTAGQLRTQLRIVHETTKEIAEKPLGCVVPADAIYFQEKADMLQSGVLLREIAQVIEELDDGTEDGKLRSRLCATIFLIGKLPTDGAAATGVRATAGALVDLLVEDLMAGSGALRKRVPELLNELVDKGALMLVDDEYRLQTRESAEWEVDYRGRYARIQADDSRLASDRSNEFKNAIASELKGISLVQGTSKTPRKYELHFGAEFPSTDSAAAPVWVRDEWSVSEKTVRQDAQMAGVDSPVVFVFLPRQDADALKSALARHAAAKETFDTRPIPTTPEGIEARNAMNSRLQIERGKLDKAIGAVIANAKVFQGGGNEVAPATFQSTVRVALEAALVRLCPKFSLVDHPNWGLVTTRAGQGAADA
ncbi:MAG: BREX system P-loop protein BrxC, partial [Chloroflexi bacterium]|nr:BREX system P-loop protein BrxC [Chloroflexota bacterium]